MFLYMSALSFLCLYKQSDCLEPSSEVMETQTKQVLHFSSLSFTLISAKEQAVFQSIVSKERRIFSLHQRPFSRKKQGKCSNFVPRCCVYFKDRFSGRGACNDRARRRKQAMLLLCKDSVYENVVFRFQRFQII